MTTTNGKVTCDCGREMKAVRKTTRGMNPGSIHIIYRCENYMGCGERGIVQRADGTMWRGCTRIG